MMLSIPKGLKLQLLLFLLQLLALESSWSATVLHSPTAIQAISHQSFGLGQQAQSTLRIINERDGEDRQQLLQLSSSLHPGPAHTPAHLTFAARPVVHQMLPRIKPVRSISYANLRSLSSTTNQQYRVPPTQLYP